MRQKNMYGKRRVISKGRYSAKPEYTQQAFEGGSSLIKQKPGAYAKALLDPENASPCVIPDLNTYPTNVYSSTTTYTLPTTAGGVGGTIVYLGSNPTSSIYQEAGTSTDAAYAYTSAADLTGASTIQANYRASRVVAASIRVEHTGNDTNNQGTIAVTSYANKGIDTEAGSLVNQTNFRNTYVGAFKNGCRAIYRPVDATNFAMYRTDLASTYSFGILQVHFTGAPVSNSNICTVTVTVFFEGITKLGQDLEGARVHTSMGEFDATNSIISNVDLVGSGTENSLSSASYFANVTANSIATAVGVTGGAFSAVVGGVSTLYRGYKQSETVAKAQTKRLLEAHLRQKIARENQKRGRNQNYGAGGML